MTDEERDVLMGYVRLGLDARQVLGDRLGKYLEERAQTERLRVAMEMEKVSPLDSKAIARLQVEGLGAAKALTWLTDALERGEQAESQLI